MPETITQRATEVVSPRMPHGMDLLDTPLLNKGTAFSDAERTQFGLHGLLPPHVETLEEQVMRAYEAYARKDDDLERHIYLRALQDNNEVLFYRLLLEHIEEMTLAGNSPALEDPSASLLPPLTDLRRVVAEIAVAVGIAAQKDGVAAPVTEDELRRQVTATQWTPDYPAYCD